VALVADPPEALAVVVASAAASAAVVLVEVVLEGVGDLEKLAFTTL
jgi:hypothetical protein